MMNVALMSHTSARLSLVFSCVGHAFMHLFAVYFFLVVLPLEQEWGLPYHELIELWTIGALLVGALALPAGWLGDRWSAPGMLVIFFLGLGGAALVCGLSGSPRTMWIGLCLLGAFAAIYHPVGVAWLVRSATESRGKILGLNGIFGSAGVASAGLIAGTLIDLFDWRIAFVVPGGLSILTGAAMWGCMRAGWITDDRPIAPPAHAGERAGQTRAFVLLMMTMFGGALIYQAMQAAMPKLFAVRLVDLVGGSAFGVGALVAVVYGIAGLTQVVSGHLADRFDLKRVYVATFVAQVPMLWLASGFGGMSLVAASTILIVANTGALPAETMLLAGAIPERHHGLAFGVKFVLAFGAAPVAIRLVAYVNDATGGFSLLFIILAAVGAAVVVIAAFLPKIARPAPHAGQSPEPNTLAQHAGTL